MTKDFAITQAVMEHLDGWVATIASSIGSPVRVPIKGGFWWRYAEESPRVLILAKAVRMASGIRAAWLLADSGHTVESFTLLRSVSDFATEVISVCEGILEGRMTESQQKFVDQFFGPVVKTP